MTITKYYIKQYHLYYRRSQISRIVYGCFYNVQFINNKIIMFHLINLKFITNCLKVLIAMITLSVFVIYLSIINFFRQVILEKLVMKKLILALLCRVRTVPRVTVMWHNSNVNVHWVSQVHSASTKWKNVMLHHAYMAYALIKKMVTSVSVSLVSSSYVILIVRELFVFIYIWRYILR